MTTPFPKHLRSLGAAMDKIKKERLEELKKSFPPWYVIWGESVFGRFAFLIGVFLTANFVMLYPIFLLGPAFLIAGGLIFGLFSFLLSLLVMIRAYELAIQLCNQAMRAPFRVHDYRHRKNRRRAIEKVSDQMDLAVAAVDELKAALVHDESDDLSIPFRPIPVDSTRVRIAHELEAMRGAVRAAYDPEPLVEYADIDDPNGVYFQRWRRAMADYESLARKVEAHGKQEKD